MKPEPETKCVKTGRITLLMSLDHHVSYLRQLLLLPTSSTSTYPAVVGLRLIGHTRLYAVVNSRIDYCNNVLAGAPESVMDNVL